MIIIRHKSMKQSKNVDWDQYLEEMQRLSEQQNGKPWQEILSDVEEDKKERACQALKKPDVKKSANWSQTSTDEIIKQLPITSGTTVKEFYVRIYHWATGRYTFSIYQIANKIHRHILVTKDIRFVGQDWLIYFESGSQGFTAEIGADIILFLQDIQDLMLLV